MSTLLKHLIVIAALARVLMPCDVVLGGELPLDVFKHEVMRLQETWHLLDQLSEKIWPGWNNYSSVPFLFEYPDGTRLLIGHPAPPAEFVLYDSTLLPGKTIFIDRHLSVPLEMKPPLAGGGGPLPIGLLNGKQVKTVTIHLSATVPDSTRALTNDACNNAALPPHLRTQLASERQILIYIHELFHCFQETQYKWRYGNLRYNPDENYATYAEVEGLALERGFLEADTACGKEYLKDFLVARELKRKSMTLSEQQKESEQELMEGGATYAEMRTLDLIPLSPVHRITHNGDPFFFSFIDRDSLVEAKMQMLRTSRVNTFDASAKCYAFGAVQAMLLGRYLPSWQVGFFAAKKSFDEIIGEWLKLPEAEKARIRQRIQSTYPVTSIFLKHKRVVTERDSVFESFRFRKGLSYIINFKPTGEYPGSLTKSKKFTLGLMEMYPDGIDSISVEQVHFTGTRSPILLDQLYHLQWVDTDSKAGETGYTLTYTRKEGTDTYCNAVFKTKGFEVKAPKIRVVQHPSRIKLTILSKVQ
jgi:hypothetical protein